MEKQCPRCCTVKPADEFHRNKQRKDGLTVYCKPCGRTLASTFGKTPIGRVKNREARKKYNASEHGRTLNGEYAAIYNKEQRHKKRAHLQCWRAVKEGTLARLPCEVCGATEKIKAHHEDYNKPLDVHWLCRKHHIATR